MDPYKPESDDAPPPPPVLPPVDPRSVPPAIGPAGPTLPPPPMAEEVVDEPGDVRLPWVAVPLLAFASPLASVPWWIGMVGSPYLSVADVAMSLGWSLGYGMLFASIFVAADRLIRNWSRPLRWAAGRGLPALLPISAISLAVQGHLTGTELWWYLGVQVIWSAPTSAVAGLILGRAAGRERGLFLRLPATYMALWLAFMFARAVWQIGLASYLPDMVIRRLDGPNLLGNIVFGVLYGLALAISLHIARRRAADGL